MANTVKIKIPEPDEVFNSAFLPFIIESPETMKPLVILEGGRGSAKSRSVGQRLSLSSLKHKLRIAFVRKVADTIRNSQYQEVRDQVNQWGLGSQFEFLTSMLTIKNKRGSEFIAAGLDKISKIKSLANVDIVWIEEAEELTAEDFLGLSLTVRGNSPSGVPKQIILTFNRTAGNWTEKEFFNADGSFIEREDCYHLHTTFKDNKFLDDAFLNRLEYLRTHDEELYRKNALGLPIALKGLIYTNWKLCDEFPKNGLDVANGLDFGHNDPNVLTKVGIQGHNIYVDELLYKRGQSVGDLLTDLDGLLKDGELESKYQETWADSEAPDKIKDIYDNGWNVKPCEKGKGSVQFGIELIKGYTVHITRRSTNIRKDFENYKWLADKQGNPIDKIQPRHAYSHGPDAVRYAVVMLLGGFKLTESELKSTTVEVLESVTAMGNY